MSGSAGIASVGWATGDLLNELSHFNDLLRQRPATLPGYREVWNDLKQLEVEFGSIQQEGWELRVQTDPITLEDVELGSFQITLRLDCLHHRDLGSVLRVKALDPNPASCDESITHPHVSGESICTGEATAPIHSALRQGRLCDVFLLVRSVLETYNSGSPYVSLENWFGSRCSDCGDQVSEDDRYSCNRCGDVARSLTSPVWTRTNSDWLGRFRYQPEYCPCLHAQRS